jgi:hypothetical protein
MVFNLLRVSGLSITLSHFYPPQGGRVTISKQSSFVKDLALLELLKFMNRYRKQG